MNIETTKLTLYLNGTIVMNDVSLNIPNASVTSIVGPNGSGKSSLLEVFTGELGNFVGKLTKIPRESISYLPQSLDSPPFLTLNEIISLGFYGQRIDKKIKDGYSYPKIFLVHYRFNDEIFNGTLFEVELIRDKMNEWSILIGDIYIYRGEKLNTKQIR